MREQRLHMRLKNRWMEASTDFFPELEARLIMLTEQEALVGSTAFAQLLKTRFELGAFCILLLCFGTRFRIWPIGLGWNSLLNISKLLTNSDEQWYHMLFH